MFSDEKYQTLEVWPVGLSSTALLWTLGIGLNWTMRLMGIGQLEIIHLGMTDWSCWEWCLTCHPDLNQRPLVCKSVEKCRCGLCFYVGLCILASVPVYLSLCIFQASVCSKPVCYHTCCHRSSLSRRSLASPGPVLRLHQAKASQFLHGCHSQWVMKTQPHSKNLPTRPCLSLPRTH